MKKSYCVYAIRIGQFVKIGYTENLEVRINNLRFLSPYEAEILLDFSVPNKMCALTIERLVLERLTIAGMQYKGEWFHSGENILAIILLVTSEYSQELLNSYSKTQEELIQLKDFMRGWGWPCRYSTASKHLISKNMPNAARFVETLGRYNCTKGLVFAESGSDEALLDYLAEHESLRAPHNEMMKLSDKS